MVPPAIPGLGASGGLQLQLEDRKNLGPTEMQHAVETLLASYRSKPQLLNLSCMYQANTPQYLLKIDRDKVQMLGLQFESSILHAQLLYGSGVRERFRGVRTYLPS